MNDATKTCARSGCGALIVGRRKDARYHSSECKTADHNARRQAMIEAGRAALAAA